MARVLSFIYYATECVCLIVVRMPYCRIQGQMLINQPLSLWSSIFFFIMRMYIYIYISTFRMHHLKEIVTNRRMDRQRCFSKHARHKCKNRDRKKDRKTEWKIARKEKRKEEKKSGNGKYIFYISGLLIMGGGSITHFLLIFTLKSRSNGFQGTNKSYLL